MTFAETNTNSRVDEDEIDLGQLLRRLWAGKFWIAGFASVAMALGVAIVMATPPTYRADALLQLEEKAGALALPTALSDLAGSDPRSVTEIEIIRSRLVLGKAIADLHLDWQAIPLEAPYIGYAFTSLGLPLPEIGAFRKFSRGDAAIHLDLLEVSPEWIGKELHLTAIADQRFKVQTPDGSEFEGEVGKLLSIKPGSFGLRIGELSAPAGREFILRQIDETAAINALRNRLSVSERGRQSSILEVSLTGGDRNETQRALAAITEAYLRQNVSRSAAEAESSLRFIEQQLPAAENAVAKAEQALNVYREVQQTIDLGFEGHSLLTQIGTIETELRRLADEEDQIAERYTPNHPVYQQLLNSKARLNEQLTALRSEAGALPTTQREVFNLTRDLELAQEGYLQLLNRAQELRVLKASSIGNVRIVDAARTAPAPIAPRKSRIVGLSLILGLMAGVGFILAMHWMRRGIQGPDELERIGLPVFATVNRVRQFEGIRRQKSHQILALTEPNHLASEAFRSLRTSLHFGMLDAKTRSVMLTSAAPGAGKTFTALNLAVVAAQAGQKVCLLDADLRRGDIRRYIHVEKDALGLSDVLSGDAGIEDVISEGPVEGLSVLVSGPYPPNPSELLMRPAFAELITELDRRFDLTIIDTPPVLAVTDPAVIGRIAGSCIIVSRYGVTPLAEVEAVMRQLRGAGIKPAGVVLNAFDPEGASSTKGYHYSYRYGYRRVAE